jgi:hypothetical protein
MSNGVPMRQGKKIRSKHSFWYNLFVSWDIFWNIFWNIFAGILFFGLCSLPFILYFMRHSGQWEIVVKLIFTCIALTICFLISKFMKVMVTKMFERLMMNPDEKEFAKITRNVSREKYIALKMYFKATGTSVESANKFLTSCRGVAFLDAYDKTSILNNVEISKLILDVEREEQIVSCALDILKAY